jgi:hypothetical protein
MEWSDVATFSGGFLLGALTGAAGGYLGTRFTDARKRGEDKKKRKKQFHECRKEMPSLFAEMRADFQNHSLVREIILLHKGTIYNNAPGKIVFNYEHEQHDLLQTKMELLASKRFIENITYNNTERYKVTDEFVELLLAEKF